MRSVLRNLVRGTALLLGVVLASAVLADEPNKPAPSAKPSVHVMQIYNGPNRSVHYFGAGLSEGDLNALGDLERAENEVKFASALQSLRMRYVADERALQPLRRNAQMDIYGATPSAVAYGASGALGYGPSFAGYFSPNLFPLAYGGGALAAPFGFPYASPGFFAPGYYGGGTGGIAAAVFGSTEEGSLKSAIVQSIGKQADPEFAAMANKGLAQAWARVNESSAIQTAMGLPDRGGVKPAGRSTETPYPVVLTLKGGDEVRGDKLREEGDWYIVDMGKEEVRVRKADVVRMRMPKTEAKP
jgi:hypothetical protein